MAARPEGGETGRSDLTRENLRVHTSMRAGALCCAAARAQTRPRLLPALFRLLPVVMLLLSACVMLLSVGRLLLPACVLPQPVGTNNNTLVFSNSISLLGLLTRLKCWLTATLKLILEKFFEFYSFKSHKSDTTELIF